MLIDKSCFYATAQNLITDLNKLLGSGEGQWQWAYGIPNVLGLPKLKCV
jgi:hypothetical protein